MSQDFDIGPGFDFMLKNGNFMLLLHDYFFRFHKIKN